MRARLLEHLEAANMSKGMRVHGPRDPSMRLPNTLSVGVPGLEARELLERVRDRRQFMVPLRSSRVHHLFEKMVDAHRIRDEDD